MPNRDWTHIRQAWTAAFIGFEYGTVSSIEDAIDETIGGDFENLPTPSVLSFPGRNVAALQDATDSALRGAYILATAQNCLMTRQPSWASLDAYHCSLVFCRAVLGFLGLYFVRIKDTNCVIDIFPEGADGKSRKAFRRQYKQVADPIRLFYRKRGSLIEQAGVWALLVRALRTATLPPSLNTAKRLVLEVGEGFGRARNDILYNNHEWRFAPDLMWPVSFLDLNDDLGSYTDLGKTFSTERDANFALCRAIASIAVGLINDIGPDAGATLLPSYYGPKALAFRTFKTTGA